MVASQPTISRTIAKYTPILGELLTEWVPTVEDLDPAEQLIIDGTLLPCWSWADHRELWSGKHRTTGLNVQVACTPSGPAGLGLRPASRARPMTPMPSANPDCWTEKTVPSTSGTKATSDWE